MNKRAEESLELLADSAAMMHESLDLAKMLENLARVIVPRLATLCAVDLLDGDTVTTVVFRADAGNVERLAHSETPARAPSGDTLLANVLRTGEARIVTGISEAFLRTNLPVGDCLNGALARGVESLLVAPIRNGTQVIGAITLAREHGDRIAFDDGDRRTLASLGVQAGSAIRNARLYDSALQARQARDDAMSVVSRDLRGCLQSIARAAAGLALHGNDPELDTIRCDVARADSIIADLSVAALLSDGAVPLRLRSHSLAALFHSVLDENRASAGRQRVDLVFDSASAPPLPEVHCDGRRILQVLDNLIRNALAHTPEGGRIVIDAITQGERVVIRVSDNGSGISSTDQAHIFYPFSRGGVRRAGAGLGLAVSKRILDLHGGSLHVSSQLGSGTTVTLSLPICGDAAASTSHPSHRVDTADVFERAAESDRLLPDAQSFAESVVDTVRESLIVLDGDLRVRSANRAFFETFGLCRGDVIGKRLGEINQGDWDIAPLTASHFEAMRAGTKLEAIQVDHEFRGVGRRSLRVSGARIEHTRLVLLALENVTEKVHAWEAQTRSEAEFRAVLTHAAEAILMVGGEGRVVFANRRAGDLFGRSPDAMCTLHISTMVPERFRERFAHDCARFVEKSKGASRDRRFEMVGLRKDGTEFPGEISLSPLCRKNEHPLMLAYIADVTARREADNKIRDYQNKLRAMTFEATVAEERERRRIASDLHDRIGQSLSLAQVKLSMVVDTCLPPSSDAVRSAIDLLRQSVEDTRALTFELSPPLLYDLGLVPAMAWLAEDLERRFGIVVAVVDDGAPKPLDETMASVTFRAIRELLMNALKHSQTLAATVSLSCDEDDLRIAVDDDGVGFALEEESLWSASGTFGLFSVREQMGRLGGSVELHSAPAQGTHVTLRLPLRSSLSGRKR
jgi:PAS domain S-box-containing protein